MDVLIVEDDGVYGPALQRALQRAGFDATLIDRLEPVLADERRYTFAVVDLALPDGSGLEAVQHLTARGTLVVVLTGHGSIPAAVECMRAGAVDFLTKPVSTAELTAALDRAQATPTAAEAPSERLDDVEKAHILAVLEDCGGNISEAARRLGLYRRTLQRKLYKL
ncbi:MAG: response regulator [Alphaproteobacteria bacterium]|nr:response regulator [Alphaproteobacteria bacterium]